MATKEKTHRDQLQSVLLLTPTALGVVKFHPEVLKWAGRGVDKLGSVIEKVFGQTPIVEDIIRTSQSITIEGSGESTRRAFTRKGSDIITNARQQRTNQTLEFIRREQAVAARLAQEQMEKTSAENILLLEEKFRRRQFHSLMDVARQQPARERIIKYLKFLAYKEQYGLRLEDAFESQITFELLDRYATLFDNLSKDPGNTKLRQSYIRLLKRAEQEQRFYRELVIDVYGRIPEQKPYPELATHQPGTIRISNLTPTGQESYLSIERTVREFLLDADLPEPTQSAWQKLMGLPNTSRSNVDQQAREITQLYNELRNKIQELKNRQDRFFMDLLREAVERDQVKKFSRAMDAIDGLDVQLKLQYERFGGFTHKSVIIEVVNRNATHYQPLRLRIPVETGPFMSRGAHALPTVSPRYAPFGSDNILDPTSRVAQMYRAVADKIVNDIADSGVPLRALNVVQSTLDRVFGQSSPISGTIRDIIRQQSVIFEDLNLAIGKGSYRDYRRLIRGVPSLDELSKLGAGNEHMLVFDLEFTHPDLAQKGVGPQKVIRDPRTKVYNISAKIINTATWEEVGSIDILIDPGKAEWYDYIKQFYINKGVDPKDVEHFINNELRGPSGEIGPNRLRRKNFAEAIRDLIDFAEPYNALRVRAGHNIAGADIVLLKTLFEQLQYGNQFERDTYEALKPQMMRFLKMDPWHGTDGIIDSFAIAGIYGLGELNQGLSLEAQFKAYTGLDDTAFGAILQQAQVSKAEEIPEAALKRIAEENDVPYQRVLELFRKVRRMKLTATDSILKGAHAGGVDVALNTIVLMYQQQNLRKLPYNFDKYWHLHEVAREVLQHGNTAWFRTFEAMDLYRPNVFTALDDEESLFNISLFSSSQQQAAKLIGSLFQMHHLIPFGLLNNLMRQKYQAFMGWQFAPPTKELLSEITKGPFQYMPGNVLSTTHGAALYDSFRNIFARGQRDLERGGLHTSLQLPVFYAPEGHQLVWESQAVMHEAARKITRYFRGAGSITTIEIDLPKKWEMLSPQQIYQEIGRDLGKPIRQALERRLNLLSGRPDWNAFVNADATISRHEVAAIMDRYYRLKPEERMSDPVLHRYMLFADKEDDIWLARRLHSSRPVKFDGSHDAVVVDVRIDKESGKLQIMLDTITEGGPGTKYTIGTTKNAKSVVFQTFGGRNQALDFSASQVAMVVGSKFGGSRNEIGSFYSVQIGRILLKLNNDPTYNRNPHHLVRAAREALRPFLGESGTQNIVARQLPGVPGQYYLEVRLPSIQSMQLYEMISPDRLLESLYKTGITWSFVEESFQKQARQMGLNRQRALELYNKTIDEYRKKLDQHIIDLQKRVNSTTSGEEMRTLEKELQFYRKIRTDLGQKDKPALFDIELNKIGDRLLPVMGFRAIDSLQVMQDLLDYVDKDINELIESRYGVPLGHTRFKPYFYTLFEEGILNSMKLAGGSAAEALEMLSYLDSRLGISYVSQKTQKMPVAEAMAWIQQSIKLLKKGSLPEQIDNIEDLFEAVDWLREIREGELRQTPIGRALGDARKYRILRLTEYKDIISRLSEESRRAIWNRLQYGDEIPVRAATESLLQYGFDERSAAEMMRGIHLPYVLAQTLEDMPIFNPNDRAALNLLQIPSPKTLLKMAGYTEEDIARNPKLQEISKLRLQMDVMEDVIQEFLRDLPVSDARRAVYEHYAQRLGKLTIGEWVAVPSFTGLMAMPTLQRFGQDVHIWGRGQEAVLRLMGAITDYAESIKARGEAIELNEVIIKKRMVEQALRDVMIDTLAPGLRLAVTKANTMFERARYRLHGLNLQFEPVLTGILAGQQQVSTETLAQVLNLAVAGTEMESEVRLIEKTLRGKPGYEKQLRELAQKARVKFRNKTTFGGLGLGETIIAMSEAKEIAENLRKLNPNDRWLQEQLDEWLAGRRGLAGVNVREPSFAHQLIPVTEAYVMPDEVLDIMGIDRKARRAMAFLDPYTAKSIFGDFDADIIAQIQMGDAKALRQATKMAQGYKRMMLNYISLMDKDINLQGTVDVTSIHVLEKGRYVFGRHVDDRPITPEVDEVVPKLWDETITHYRDRVRQYLIIKSYTGTIGADSLRHIMLTGGQESPFNMLGELLLKDNQIADMIGGKEEVLSAISWLRQPLDRENPLTAPINIIRGWYGLTSEGLSIKIKAKEYGTEPIAFLRQFDAVRRRIGTERFSKEEVDFLLHNKVLQQSELTLPQLFSFLPEQDRERVARKAITHYNTVINAIFRLNKQVEGTPLGDWLNTFSSTGMPDRQRFLETFLGANPGLTSALRRRRSGIEKALGFGMGVDPLRVPLGELAIQGEVDAGNLFLKTSLNEILGDMINKESLTSAIRDFADSMLKPEHRSALMLGALALGTLWFFSPNQGVSPIGAGGEQYDWPQSNIHVNVRQSLQTVMRPPALDKIEKLLDIQYPDSHRKPVGYPVPPPPPRPAYKSDLRRRNWRMNDYIRRADAVLLT